MPSADESLRLLHCAGHRDPRAVSSEVNLKLQVNLMRCLLDRPNFLSLTLTDTDPFSILLEASLLTSLSYGVQNVDFLMGSKTDILRPIMLDLRSLPLEATGIVCGVAGRLAEGTSESVLSGMGTEGGNGAVEMSFLSTARAGTVIVSEEELERAVKALEDVERAGWVVAD